jgi:hypothetical protein
MQALWTARVKRPSQGQYVGMDDETLCNSAQGFRAPSADVCDLIIAVRNCTAVSLEYGHSQWQHRRSDAATISAAA